MEKITDVQMYATIKELLADNAGVVAFCDKKLAQNEARNAKTKEKRALKKAETDTFTEAVYGVLGTEPMTVKAVVEALDMEGVTNQKVISRLSELARTDRIVKTSVVVDGKAKVAYTVAG